MPRCCSNIFLNQFTQQPPDVIVDPPGANFCYFWEDFSVPETSSTITMDYVTINGVQTAINKEVFIDWGFDLFSFLYETVVNDLTAASATAGVAGMGFFVAYQDALFSMRFSITGENISDASITYTYDAGAGPVQTTTPLQSDCALHYDCFEATYTPEEPFLIDNGIVFAVSNTGLNLFETNFFGPFCTEFHDGAAYSDPFQFYIQTLHGTQSSSSIVLNGNTATVTIYNTLLHPLHMDNQADSGACSPPNSLTTQNNFTLIDCP